MNQDEKYMQRALQLAKLGNGSTSPNPMVGAVIVCDDKIIGEGYHKKCGGPHAEVNAIDSVKNKELLKRSTIYVTLEPCSHYGKTPPCANLIIENNIPNVIIGTLDPFEKVSGRGVKMLNQAGVNVKSGVLEKECKDLNYKFIKAHEQHRPYILLKWAQTANGYIGGKNDVNPSTLYISNPETKMLVHKERSLYDAIMVGSGTVITDNPTLTVRDYAGRNPLRVVLCSNNELTESLNIFNNEVSTLIFTTKDIKNKGNSEYFMLKDDEDIISQILKELYRRNITSLMVEGGAMLLNSFISNNQWDEARIEVSKQIIDDGVPAPNVNGALTNVEKHGENLIYRFIRS